MCTGPGEMRLTSSYLAFLIAAMLLVVAFVAVVITAPISEISVRIQNLDEFETVSMVLYLDDSIEAYSCAGPGLWISWKLHVVPGTHSIGIDYVFSQSFENEPDQVIDFEWTTYVGFNGVENDWFIVDDSGIGPHLADLLYKTSSPLEQAVNDPHVMAPALTLTVLLIVLFLARWNMSKTQQRDTPGKEP
ncbi:TPA: hypothetical protein HA259_01720 [Thermoplasmata archaeon]|nr:hypothetical protein [Thermoplasmata archaeon]